MVVLYSIKIAPNIALQPSLKTALLASELWLFSPMLVVGRFSNRLSLAVRRGEIVKMKEAGCKKGNHYFESDQWSWIINEAFQNRNGYGEIGQG